MTAPWWLSVILWWLVFCRIQCGLVCDSSTCSKGACVNGTCVCDAAELGGSECWTCVGRILFTEPSGRIQYGVENYPDDGSCIWLVQPENFSSASPLRLTVNSFSTRCGSEYLYAFEGTSAHDVQTLALTGDLYDVDRNTLVEPLQLTFYSGAALLYFKSNSTLPWSYIDISYSNIDCPHNCSGHGMCSDLDGLCICDYGWTGQNCDVSICPTNCSGYSKCTNGHCNCSGTGFRGPDCATPESSDLWSKVSADSSQFVGGRASHAAVVRNDEIWLYGGYSLCLLNSLVQPLLTYAGCDIADSFNGTLFRFIPSRNQWTKVFPAGLPAPASGYGHSMVLRKTDEILIYGGTSGQRVIGDLWSYNVTQHLWRRRVVNASVPLTGHTAHMVNDTLMLLVFGYSPTFGYSSVVYNLIFFDDGSTQMAAQACSADSATVHGGYGHSSVYDEVSGVVYVYGGYKPYTSASAMGHHASSDLYAYDVLASRWSILRPGPLPLFLHSAVLLGRTMFIFGGSCGDRTRKSQSDDGHCYVSSLLGYDLECKIWKTANKSTVAGSARFGHAAVAMQGRMYVIGGFNGLTLSDVLLYEPGRPCSATVNQSCDSDSTTTSVTDTSVCPRTTFTDAERGIVCSSFESCFLCLGSQYGCKWNTSNNACTSQCPTGRCKETIDQCDCFGARDCRTCLLTSACKYISVGCVNSTKFPWIPSVTTCSPNCASAATCDACTAMPSCAWCGSSGNGSGICYDRSAYVPMFPYGQCLRGASSVQQCQAVKCPGHQTCAECLEDPYCGWYDDGQSTGAGLCLEGTTSGPFGLTKSDAAVGFGLPSRYNSSQWHTLQCPLCQCNGHSRCFNDTDVCIACDYPTEGPRCSSCMRGFYGNPANGGTCSACKCESRSEGNLCDRVTGACICSTRGAIGSRCNICDNNQKYFGSPDIGIDCYYPLAAEYRYTFNFSKPEELRYTRVNLRCSPTLNDSDVEVEISCSKEGHLNFTLEADGYADPMSLLLSGTLCTSSGSKLTYGSSKYNIGPKYNATFVLTVYDYKMPFLLVISFTQPGPGLDLLHFFVIFFSCFVALLLIVGIAWRLKLRHAMRRQQERIRQQRQVMAKRAFAELFVELEQEVAAAGDATGVHLPGSASVAGKNRLDSSPVSQARMVAAEPLSCQKVAVVSALIRLPTGGHSHCQPGQYGMAIASAIVALPHAGSSAPCPKAHTERLPWAKAKRSSSTAAAQQPPEFSYL